ncbi:hypothetical protein IAT40_002544 [Kwoniella sp. CBS 6097]
MTSQDVRSILNLPQAGPSTSAPKKLSSAAARKPDGITRELYALIGDNAPSLAQAQASLASVKYRERPSLKKKVHCQFEYDQHLQVSDWTSQETTYLFDLLKQYDLRFIIVADRYEYKSPTGQTRKRSVEELKDRYYTICRRLIRTRTASDPAAQQQLIHAYSFDKSREVKRKQYASELFHLTAAEIAEEEALYIEIKRMEQNERRYRADRDDLMRTVMGFDSGLLTLDQSNVDTILGVDKNKKRKRMEEGEPVVQEPPPTKTAKDSAAFGEWIRSENVTDRTDAAHCIYRLPPPPSNPQSSHLASKHPVHQAVHLRSTKLPLPKPTASIRITEMLGELGISAHKLVMPTRGNIEAFDSLLQAAGSLIDMKRQVDRVEQELRTIRSESVTSTDTSITRRSRPL